MIKKTCLFLLIVTLTACNEKSNQHKICEVSESIADILWAKLNDQDLEYDIDLVLETLKKNAEGKRTPMEEPRTVLSKYLVEIHEKESKKALVKAETFMANLSTKDDHKVVLPGKVIYRVINPGNGSSTKDSSSPQILFSERDLDGEILFDGYKSNIPIKLKLDETIRGFKLGVSGMKVGERREIFIHPDLAYKKLGKTKPNQLLIYDVTIIEE